VLEVGFLAAWTRQDQQPRKPDLCALAARNLLLRCRTQQIVALPVPAAIAVRGALGRPDVKPSLLPLPILAPGNPLPYAGPASEKSAKQAPQAPNPAIPGDKIPGAFWCPNADTALSDRLGKQRAQGADFRPEPKFPQTNSG
jgi:hypothetical protein